MPTSKNMLLSILAMDSYNRGYRPGIEGLGDAGSKVGAATMLSTPVTSAHISANFYASAYSLDGGGKVISFRGTDAMFGDGTNPLEVVSVIGAGVIFDKR
jgi:hypothetical protein